LECGGVIVNFRNGATAGGLCGKISTKVDAFMLHLHITEEWTCVDALQAALVEILINRNSNGAP
jgi:hypothetical protein